MGGYRQIFSNKLIVVMSKLHHFLGKYSLAAIARTILERILTASEIVTTVPYARIYRRNTRDPLISILGGNSPMTRDEESRDYDEGAQLETIRTWIKNKEREAQYVQVAVWKKQLSKLTTSSRV